MELLIGAGAKHEKRFSTPRGETWTKLVTLDINPEHKPDVLHNLEDLPLPFEDNTFDEIHAYEVLEHIGQQGDWRFFFDQWSDFWRILKPDGLVCGTSPMRDTQWTWGDPGHTRVVSKENLLFLNQDQYAQVGTTAMTDYRFYYKAHFVPALLQESEITFQYVLQAKKDNQ